MIKLKSLLLIESADDNYYYYHVTLAPYVSKIQRQGLAVNRPNKPTVSNYKEYSRGKIFLCDCESLEFWINKIGEHAFHQHDDERYHAVAVFRITKTNLETLGRMTPDQIGSKDSGRGAAFYVTTNIPPNMLEFVKIIEDPY